MRRAAGRRIRPLLKNSLVSTKQFIVIFINMFRLLHAGKGHFAAIQMIFAAALTAPHAKYDGSAHGGMANGALVQKVYCRFMDDRMTG